MKIWATVVVSGGFGSASILVKVTVDMTEVNGSVGQHVIVWVV